MFATLEPRAPRRRALRRTPHRRGEVDGARTLRQSLRRMGEPAPIQWRRRTTRPRRVVLLVDVSGSMSKYADALLRLAHRFVTATKQQGAQVEVFTTGTRLTRVTRALQHRDPERALIAAGRRSRTGRAARASATTSRPSTIAGASAAWPGVRSS